jgi:predicted acylesterase/phospholipase RssA
MQRVALVALILAVGSYALVAFMHWPWPLRFHLLVILGGVLAWLIGQPGPMRDLGRGVWQRLIPETRGRGLWRGASRRRLLDQLVSEGRPGRLVDRSVRLVMSACDMNSGRMTYFVNPPATGPEFQAAVEKSLGEVALLSRVADVIDAAVASSAVPVLYEPEPFRGREYLDGGLFSNQPLRAVAALNADAILLVLVSPSVGPSPSSEGATLIDIASRLNELSNWRDLQGELRDLPAQFSRDARPASVCVIEPAEPLGGSMFDFDPSRSGDRITMGEHDTWLALEAVGWLEPDPEAPLEGGPSVG